MKDNPTAQRPTFADIYPALYRLEHYALDVFLAHGYVLTGAKMTTQPKVTSAMPHQALIRVANPQLIARLAESIPTGKVELNVAKIIAGALPRLWEETTLKRPSWWFASSFASLTALVPDAGTNKLVGPRFMSSGGGGGRRKRETDGLTTYLGTVMEELEASGKKPSIPNILIFIEARQRENGGRQLTTGIAGCEQVQVVDKRLSWLQSDGTWAKSVAAKTLYSYRKANNG